MKKTKLLLGSLAIACALSACSHKDEAVVANPEATLAGRPQVNLVLSSPAETRLEANGLEVNFTTNDQLGAVLVDGGYLAEGWNKVKWTIIDGHAGNNKWFWDGEKFSTEGTTAVGSWLFYSLYDEAMTTKRAGVEFSFPQIQDGAVDLTKVANNNINFHISPIMNIDGQEGDYIKVPVKYASVYNYMNIKLAFDNEKVTSVEKIIVSATDKNGAAVKFPAKSKVSNSALNAAGAVAKMSLANDAPVGVKVPDHNGDGKLDREDQVVESKVAYAALSDIAYANGEFIANWDAATTTVGTLTEGISEEAYDYLVVDCGAHSKDLAVVDGKFNTWMLMPAGVYQKITLKIYTNVGVYTKVVWGMEHHKEMASYNASYTNGSHIYAPVQTIVLRPQVSNSIANIKANEVEPADDYLFISAKSATAMSDIITNNAELINLINTISKKGEYDVNILLQDEVNGGTDAALGEHDLVINQEVMDAIVAKEAELKGDIQLVFKGEKVNIAGNATSADRLNVHDLTFTEGCDVISGYVTTSNEFVVPEGQKMTVKEGANVTFGTNYTTGTRALVAVSLAEVVIENNAKATVIGDLVVPVFTNNGTVAVNKEFTLSSEELVNNAILVVKGAVEADVYTAGKDSETTNHGVMTIGSAEASVFNGEVTNNANINIIGVAVNNGSILNNADAKFMVDGVDMDGEFTNNGEIENYGKLVAQAVVTTIKNSINNLGTIAAKAGATTWITTNSKYDETKVATNAAEQVMGVVKMDERNADLKIIVAKQQGYKVYAVSATDLVEGVLSFAKGDVFNKAILSDAAELNVDLIGKVQYVETSNDLTLPAVANQTSPYYPVKELTFTKSATFVAAGANVFELNVVEGAIVKIPVGSKVYNISMSDTWLESYDCNDLRNTKTNLLVNNDGEIWCGGKFTTDLAFTTVSYYSAGKFIGASGQDEHTFSWGTK